jgi:hypothetical protein
MQRSSSSRRSRRSRSRPATPLRWSRASTSSRGSGARQRPDARPLAPSRPATSTRPSAPSRALERRARRRGVSSRWISDLGEDPIGEEPPRRRFLLRRVDGPTPSAGFRPARSAFSSRTVASARARFSCSSRCPSRRGRLYSTCSCRPTRGPSRCSRSRMTSTRCVGACIGRRSRRGSTRTRARSQRRGSE